MIFNLIQFCSYYHELKITRLFIKTTKSFDNQNLIIIQSRKIKGKPTHIITIIKPGLYKARDSMTNQLLENL